MSALAFKERFRLSRFVRGEKPTSDAITLGHRRVFILPTMRGLGFGGLVAVLFFIGFVYNNNLVYLLSFLLASVFFITTVHSFKTLSGLIVRAGQGKPVFAGEAAAFPLHIGNPSTTPRPLLSIAGQDENGFALSPNSESQIMVYRPTHRRGWCEPGTITLTSTFPLGLFRVWSPLRFDVKVLVYPKPSALELPLPAPQAGDNADGGRRRGNEDFAGVKDYTAGDSIKHIHWKAYAKGQGLFSKQFDGEDSGSELWLDFDSAPGGDLEQRLSQLCRWLIDAEKAGLRYGLTLPGARLLPANGAPHLQACLEALALYRS